MNRAAGRAERDRQRKLLRAALAGTPEARNFTNAQLQALIWAVKHPVNELNGFGTHTFDELVKRDLMYRQSRVGNLHHFYLTADGLELAEKFRRVVWPKS